MRSRVLIVGTGLAAAGCARFFVEQGKVPIVFDVGERLAEDTEKKANDLASISPSDWPSDVEFFSSNSHAGLTNIPTKKILARRSFTERQDEVRFLYQRAERPLQLRDGGIKRWLGGIGSTTC